MNKHEHSQDERDDKSFRSSGVSRRDLIKTSIALAAGSIAIPSLLGNSSMVGEAKADTKSCSTTLSPKYYPLTPFTPQIPLHGKLAVITGASRGIGRST